MRDFRWGYKWESIYPRWTNNSAKQKQHACFEVVRWNQCASSYILSFCEHEPPSSWENKYRKYGVHCMELHRNDKCKRYVLCTTKPFEIEYKLIFFSVILCLSVLITACCTLNRQFSFNWFWQNGKKVIVPPQKVREWLYRGSGGGLGLITGIVFCL